MKLLLTLDVLPPNVAPRAGAWIETYKSKYVISVEQVAPRAGAWIETNIGIEPKDQHCVAPRAGAWIETEW